MVSSAERRRVNTRHYTRGPSPSEKKRILLDVIGDLLDEQEIERVWYRFFSGYRDADRVMKGWCGVLLDGGDASAQAHTHLLLEGAGLEDVPPARTPEPLLAPLRVAGSADWLRQGHGSAAGPRPLRGWGSAYALWAGRG